MRIRHLTVQGAGGVGGVLAVTFAPSNLHPSPSSHFVLYDGNGNVVALTDAATGDTSAVFEYGPFGELLRATGPMSDQMPLRFSTMYADDVTGDVKYLFRDLKTDEGRWTSRDPVEEKGGPNCYAFVENAPVNRIDVFGLQGFSCLCPCGPEVKDGMSAFFADLKQTFSAASPDRQKKGCAALVGLPQAANSWDFNGLLSFKWFDEVRAPLICLKFNTPCKEAVTYKGICVKKSVLNYLLIGFAASLCEDQGIEVGAGYRMEFLTLLYTRSWVQDEPDYSAKVAAFDEGHSGMAGKPRMPALKMCQPDKNSAKLARFTSGAMDVTDWRWNHIRD